MDIAKMPERFMVGTVKEMEIGEEGFVYSSDIDVDLELGCWVWLNACVFPKPTDESCVGIMRTKGGIALLILKEFSEFWSPVGIEDPDEYLPVVELYCEEALNEL